MNARVHIGDLVTVDEASEAVDAKITSLPGDFVPSEEQDLELSIGIPGVDDPMTAQEASIPNPSASIYEVVTYDLTSNTFRLKSKIGLETFRTVSHKNVIKIDTHLDKAATAALAEHYEHSPASLGDFEPVPVTHVASEAELEAERRTEIMSRHCAKKDPISKDQAMAELKVAPTTFHKIKRIFLLNPDWRAQVPGQDGRRPGEKRIDPEVDAIIFAVFTDDRKNYGANDAEALDEIERRCRKIGKRPPSRTTIWRRWHELSARERLKSTDGPEAAQATFGHFPTPTVEEFYPGRIHEIDHTPLDCHAIDSKTGEPLGRAHFTIVRDVDTEGIMGFALLFGSPKRASISAAIHMALCPKTALLAKHGMSNLHWPLYGKPEQYRTDHGSDLMAESFTVACSKEKIKHTSRMRPQSGGGVERGLGILNRGVAQTLDGATASGTKKGPGYKPHVKGVYTLEALTRILIAWICKFNNRKSRTDQLSPNQRFERKYGLHDGVVISPPTVSDPSRFVIDILEGHEVTVARNGVVTRGLVYKFGPYTKMVGEKIYIKVDPNNIHRIWGLHEDKWWPLWLVNEQTQPLTLAEQKVILKARREDPGPDHKRIDAQEELERAKKLGKKEFRDIQRAQEDVAQNERMGHFGPTHEPNDPNVPSDAESAAPMPIIIPELDEDI
ncbi:Mu transposase C-terminal domain-containing protein [Pseudomonas syringae pv. actinidiae]|uniref:Mu transposase C-terminal domain-containing protein n=3 Tax=Pseudomonas syringae group TaxID=136849 RepID=UPI000307BBDA|nr:Mu transposase C-terminal domain-containing protein [Pseudomonas syringae]EPN66913.1 integrase catalytic subunit [Pseudomonas syringae pv. actinidiae ICMP 19101]EPN70345.1 integrase catalytic subunit [Pseudomonas syringae pv. actinidiae ICMP 19079]AKT30778.1 integrase [Pseudomonas syringae pv. actinidiae ICMP 18884]AOE57194.1 integrase [Pseudomonas syringae pv. actinidiae ICMP 18708]APP98152.1 integrase [Pseudomonas syringae pv. actinidiae]